MKKHAFHIFISINLLFTFFCSISVANTCEVYVEGNATNVHMGKVHRAFISRGYNIVRNQIGVPVLKLNYKIQLIGNKCDGGAVGQTASCSVTANLKDKNGTVLLDSTRNQVGCINAFNDDYSICSKIDLAAADMLPDCNVFDVLPGFNPTSEEARSKAIKFDGKDYDFNGSLSYSIVQKGGNPGPVTLIAKDRRTKQEKWQLLLNEWMNLLSAHINLGENIDTVFVKNTDNNLRAIDKLNGKILWESNNGGGKHGFVIGDRAIFTSGFNDPYNTVTAISAYSGRRIWEYNILDKIINYWDIPDEHISLKDGKLTFVAFDISWGNWCHKIEMQIDAKLGTLLRQSDRWSCHSERPK